MFSRETEKLDIHKYVMRVGPYDYEDWEIPQSVICNLKTGNLVV